MQKSTIFFTLAVLTIFGVAYWKMAFIGGAPTQKFIPSIHATRPPSSSSSSSGGGGGGGGDAGTGATESPSDDAALSPGATTLFEGAGDEVQVDKNFKDSDPQRCVDMSGEDNPNMQLLIHRLKSFRYNFRLWRQTWGDTHVFSEASAEGGGVGGTSSSTVSVSASSKEQQQQQRYPPTTPPVMRQFLYCFTKNYTNSSTAPENNECLAEMADLAEPVNGGNYFIGSSANDMKKCTRPPIYQGNVTSWTELYGGLGPVVQQFPGPLSESERTLASISESRRWYWSEMADPFKFTCPTCVETKNLIAPSFLVGARRWFPIVGWFVLSGGSNAAAENQTVQQRPYQCLVLMEGHIRTSDARRGLSSQCSGKSEPKEGEVGQWEVSIALSEIVDIAFAHYPMSEDGFVTITVLSKKEGSLTTHLIQPMRGLYGINGFWLSLQMLYGFDIKNSVDENGRAFPLRRGLFSPSSPVFVRNITGNLTEAGCYPPDLRYMANFNPTDPRYRRMPPVRFEGLRRCWLDLISTSTWTKPTRRGEASRPIFYRNPLDGSILQQHDRFPFLPCYPPYTTALLRHARGTGNIDSHDVYWPYTCRRISHRRPCLDMKIAAMLRLKPSSPLAAKGASASGPAPDPSAILRNVKMSDLVRPRVAVCMAGFIRSFHLTRHAIFQNLVDPYDGDFFASTWNVQGRAKKTLQVLKGHILNVDRMSRRLMNLLPRDRNITKLLEQGRYKAYVFSWNLYKSALDDHSRVGWRHAGLYMLLSHSIEMAISSGREYDILIRSRWDVVPLVPLMVYPVWVTPDKERRKIVLQNQQQQQQQQQGGAGGAGDNNKLVPSWLLDTGSACEMDGFWWPRTAILRQGVVVAHTADTRFKLFSWQFCDFLHLSTFETAKKFQHMSGWAIGNYIDSGAQFVEHVYAIDQGLRWVPMQLYLKVLRETRKKKKGSKPAKYRVRMHLFG